MWVGRWVNKIYENQNSISHPKPFWREATQLEFNIVFLLFNQSVNLQGALTCIWGQSDQQFPDWSWGCVGGCQTEFKQKSKF